MTYVLCVSSGDNLHKKITDFFLLKPSLAIRVGPDTKTVILNILGSKEAAVDPVAEYSQTTKSTEAELSQILYIDTGAKLDRLDPSSSENKEVAVDPVAKYSQTTKSIEAELLQALYIDTSEPSMLDPSSSEKKEADVGPVALDPSLFQTVPVDTGTKSNRVDPSSSEKKEADVVPVALDPASLSKEQMVKMELQMEPEFSIREINSYKGLDWSCSIELPYLSKKQILKVTSKYLNSQIKSDENFDELFHYDITRLKMSLYVEQEIICNKEMETRFHHNLEIFCMQNKDLVSYAEAYRLFVFYTLHMETLKLYLTQIKGSINFPIKIIFPYKSFSTWPFFQIYIGDPGEMGIVFTCSKEQLLNTGGCWPVSTAWLSAKNNCSNEFCRIKTSLCKREKYCIENIKEITGTDVISKDGKAGSDWNCVPLRCLATILKELVKYYAEKEKLSGVYVGAKSIMPDPSSSDSLIDKTKRNEEVSALIKQESQPLLQNETKSDEESEEEVLPEKTFPFLIKKMKKLQYLIDKKKSDKEFNELLIQESSYLPIEEMRMSAQRYLIEKRKSNKKVDPLFYCDISKLDFLSYFLEEIVHKRDWETCFSKNYNSFYVPNKDLFPPEKAFRLFLFYTLHMEILKFLMAQIKVIINFPIKIIFPYKSFIDKPFTDLSFFQFIIGDPKDRCIFFSCHRNIVKIKKKDSGFSLKFGDLKDFGLVNTTLTEYDEQTKYEKTTYGTDILSKDKEATILDWKCKLLYELPIALKELVEHYAEQEEKRLSNLHEKKQESKEIDKRFEARRVRDAEQKAKEEAEQKAKEDAERKANKEVEQTETHTTKEKDKI